MTTMNLRMWWLRDRPVIFFLTCASSSLFFRSGLFNQGRQKQGAARQLGDDDVLVHGVGALAHCAHAVERGNADPCGEVAVGASAYGGFVQLPARLAGNFAGLLVERDPPFGAFHGQTIYATGDLQLAMFVEGLQRSQLAVDANFLFRVPDANVDFYRGFGGNYVGARAALNDSWIHREPAPQIVELRDGCDLAGKLQDGAVAFPRIEAGMRGHAFHLQRVLAHSLARGL